MKPGSLLLLKVSIAYVHITLYSILVCIGVGLYLNGNILPDNSMVFLSEIGEGSSALYCLTNRELCCSSAAGAVRGLWREDPDNNLDEFSPNFYHTRGFSSLLLNRRSSAVGPTGAYSCLIPDAGNTVRTLTVTVSAGKLFFI